MIKQQIAHIIQSLELVRQKPGMYIGHDNPLDFIVGFDYACITLDNFNEIERKNKVYKQIIVDRGWQYNPAQHISTQMAEKGFERERIIDEVLSIEIESWKHIYHSLPD